MAQFPRLYSQIAALGQKVLGGLQRHPEMFPSCDSEAISQALEDFYQACSDLNTADAQVKAAANTKKDTLGRLSQIIKNQVRRAQADTSSSPENMKYLGISDRKKAAAIEPPDGPTMLKVVYDGMENISLSWEKPGYDLRRPVRAYMVQKRNFTDPAESKKGWQLAGVTFDTNLELDNARPGQRIRYRVVACNDAGSSFQSNEVVI